MYQDFPEPNSSNIDGVRQRLRGVEIGMLTSRGLRLGSSDLPTTTLDLSSKESTTSLRIAAGASETSAWLTQVNDIADLFFVADEIANTSPFRIENGAPDASIHIDSDGNIGLSTAAPTADLHLYRAGATAELRIESAGAGGIATAVFKNAIDSYQIGIAVDGSFQIYDTGSGTTPLTIEDSSPSASIYVDSSGDIGIGTAAPAREFHVLNSDAGDSITFLRVEGTAVNARVGIECKNDVQNWQVLTESSDSFIVRDVTGSPVSPLTIEPNTPDNSFYLSSSGDVGLGTSTPIDSLDINGDAVRIRSSRTPASAAATGNQGAVCWDTDYIYVCVATDTWKRVGISTW